jgi:putative intracellular protease/amidase
MPAKILIIVTNVAEYETVGYRTGLWLSELTHFWDVAAEAGFEMDIASPLGGFVPLDPESLMLQEVGHAVGINGKVHDHYEDRAFMNRLKDTMRIAEADPLAYGAIYMTGGHGVCYDFPRSAALAHITARMYETGKIVAAVCHGPAGLLEVKLTNGDYLVRGKKVTGFSWKEEELAKRANAVPYNLEEELKNRGAEYSKALIPFNSYVVEDGLLITGQNPASASAVGEAVVKKLQGK